MAAAGRRERPEHVEALVASARECCGEPGLRQVEQAADELKAAHEVHVAAPLPWRELRLAPRIRRGDVNSVLKLASPCCWIDAAAGTLQHTTPCPTRTHATPQH